MSNRLKKCHPLRARCWCLLLTTLIVALPSSRNIHGQTSSTGALTGETLDPSGALLPGVILHLTKQDDSEAEVRRLGQEWPIRILIAAAWHLCVAGKQG